MILNPSQWHISFDGSNAMAEKISSGISVVVLRRVFVYFGVLTAGPTFAEH